MTVSLFLLNASGFFFQFFPCALMAFLPFSQEALRFRRRRIFMGVALATAALAALFPVALYFWKDALLPGMAANLLMLCAILMGLAAYVWLVREALLKKILVFYVVMFYAAVQYWLVNTLGPLFRSLPLYRFDTVYNAIELLLHVAITAVLLPLELTAVIRPLGEFIREIEPQKMRREFTVTAVSTTACLVLIIYCDTVWFAVLKTVEFLWLVPLYLLLICDQSVIYWLVFRESVRRRHDYERQRFLEVQRVQYDRFAGEMEKTRRLRHDLRHHLNVLGALNAQGRQEEISEYLKQYVAVYDQLSKQSFSGDPVVDSVLEYYMTLAGEANIPVNHRISQIKSTGMESADMTVLLGNCLENALEALRQLPEEQRQLSVEIVPVNSMLLLRVQNTCNLSHGSKEPAGWEDFASSKGNGHQGVGLRSVTAIAEKYGGSAQFQCKDGKFITRVFLNPMNPRK